MFKILALKDGIKLSAIEYEIITAKPTVIAKLSKNFPTIPLINETGINTAKSIDDIAKIIDTSYWEKIRRLIPKNEKIDLKPIERKIESIKNDLSKNQTDINNSNRKLSQQIDNIHFPSFPKIPTDYLKKDDFEFTMTEKLKDIKDIKEVSEDLESIPAKVSNIEKELKGISEKLDDLPINGNSKTPTHIPKQEKSVIDLAKYMTDGIAQFENIAKEYISKIDDLENLDKIKIDHKKEIETTKKEAFDSGREEGRIEIIKDIADKFPTHFLSIKSIFEDLLEEKFKEDEILEITEDNKNDIISFVEDKIDVGKYKVISSAVLLEKSILFKAKVEKVD